MNRLSSVNEGDGERSMIQHDGVVSSIVNGEAIVSLIDNISCEGCKAKGACGVSESNDKQLTVPVGTQDVQAGQQVTLNLRKGLGLKAVFWAYVFPFVLMVLTLVVCSVWTSELVAGLASMAVLLPYYLLLAYLTPVFKKKFQVSLSK